jgi:putative addiction module component (TIGR02574 family)
MGISFIDEILDKALKKPETDRTRIAEARIASLDDSTDRDIDLAWQTEIEKRLREIDNGTVQCLPWEAVQERLYRNAREQS